MASDIGTILSNILGDNTEHSQIKNSDNIVVYKSSTTNSYTKSIQSLKDQLPPEILSVAQKISDPHDKNSFIGSEEINDIFEEKVPGQKVKIGCKKVYCKGTYKYVLFAHLKTVEIWVKNEFL